LGDKKGKEDRFKIRLTDMSSDRFPVWAGLKVVFVRASVQEED
jgi:hypothetical protein